MIFIAIIRVMLLLGTACDPYNAGGSITDWFLPNKEELAQLRIFHVAANNEYFSSSQYSHASGWRQDFSNGQRNYSSKINARRVRAIRTF